MNKFKVILELNHNPYQVRQINVEADTEEEAYRKAILSSSLVGDEVSSKLNCIKL